MTGLAGATALLLGGALTAVAAVVLHPLWWGLVLGVVATSTVLVALPAGWATRLPFGLGFAGAVGWLAPSRADGGFLVSGDAPGYGLLGFTLLVLVLSLATLPRPGHPDRTADTAT